MATTWKAPTWRMPNEKNQNKFESYSLNFDSAGTDHIFLVNSSQVSSEFSGIGNANSYSFSFWINTTDSTSLGSPAWYSDVCILELRTETGSGTKVPFNIGMNSGKLFFGRTSNHTTSDQYFESTTLVNTGNWVHCAVTVEVNTLKFYINNSLDSTHTFTVATGDCSVGSTNSNFVIASRTTNAGAASAPFPGKISNINIFDYLLSSTQISSLYNSGSPINPMTLKPAPIAYYPLGGNASTGGDSSNTLSVPNIAVPDASVFNFDGSSDFIDCGSFSALNSATSVTVSAWFKSSTYSNYGRVISNNHIEIYQSLSAYSNTQGRFYYRLRGDYGNQFALLGGTSASGVGNLVDGNWHHLCVTFDNSTTTAVVYEDGVPVITNTSVSGTLNSASSNLYIGSSSASTHFIDGLLSNAQIWNTALSSSEVTTLYNSGVPLLTGTQPQEANLKAWYKLDQSANWEADTAGNWQIPDAVSSYPQSFSFAQNKIIRTPNTVFDGIVTGSNKIGICTISYWFKNNNTGVQQDYMSLNDDNISPAYFRIDSSNRILYQSKTNYMRYYAPSDIDGWNHYCWVFNSDTSYSSGSAGQTNYYDDDLKFYLNGVEQQLSYNNSAAPNNTAWNGFNIAESALSSSSSLNFKMSNLQLFDTNLSASQVQTLYNNGTPLTTAIASDNLKAWYKLNDNEKFDGTNWEIENQAYPANYENALNFGTRTQAEYIALNQLPLYNAITVSAWIKTQKNGSSRQTIISNSQPNAVANEKGWQLAIDQAWSSGYTKAGFVFYDSTGSTAITIAQTSSQELTDNKWHHVVALWDGTTNTNAAKIFVDGLLAGQGTSSFAGPIGQPVVGLEPRIGTQAYSTSGGGNNFGGDGGEDGFISNIQTWDSSLTYGTVSSIGDTAGGQIADLYNNGTPVTTVIDETNLQCWYKLDNLTTGIQDLSNNSNNGTNNGTSQASTFVSTEAATSSGMTEQNLVNNNVSALNGESSGMDTSNLVTSTLTRQVPYNSYSLKFDGSSDYIRVLDSDDLKPTSAITCSVWFKGGTQNNFRYLLSKYFSGSSNAYGFYTGSTSTKLSFYIRNSATTDLQTPDSTNIVFDNEWHHAVGVYDGSKVELYIDGVSNGSTAGTGSINYAAGMLYFGTFSGAPTVYEYDGLLSSISIFNEALTSTEIMKLYNSGVPGDLSNFSPSPVSWWSLGSDSYFDGTNYVCPDLIGTNNSYDSTGLSANSLVGDAPNSTANGTSTNMAIDANLTGNAPNSSNNSFSVNMDYTDRETSVPG